MLPKWNMHKGCRHFYVPFLFWVEPHLPSDDPLFQFMGFPSGSGVMDLPATPELQETQVWPMGWQGNPLQYSRLENTIDRGAWWAIVHRVANSWTWPKWLSTHQVISQESIQEGLLPDRPTWQYYYFLLYLCKCDWWKLALHCFTLWSLIFGQYNSKMWNASF